MDRRSLLLGMGAAGLAARAAADAPEQPAAREALPVAELSRLLAREGVIPSAVYGRRIEFTGKILRIQKGVDGGTVPYVSIDGWDAERDLYGTAYVHNVLPAHLGRPGDRIRATALIVEHGYGTLFLWCYRWRRLDPD